MNKFKWKQVNPQHGPCYYKGYIRNIQLFTIKRKLVGKGYTLVSGLPEIFKNIYPESDNIDELKEEAYKAFLQWLINTGIADMIYDMERLQP